MSVKNGFTLIELAIVLIILGLLAGGVLYGQSLIKAAELNAVASEYEKYKAAVITFKSKYFYIPGDMPNAEDFWGTMSTGTCIDATAGVGTETCNGEGDGDVNRYSSAGGRAGEPFLFWQHLANAGLIEGRYTGIAGPGGIGDSVYEENIPPSKFGGAGWSADTWDNTGGSLSWPFHLDFGNNFIFGLPCSTATHFTRCPALTSEEAWNIDTKIDDGLPANGTIVIDGSGSFTNCTTAAGDTDFTGDYDLTYEDICASLRFRNAF